MKKLSILGVLILLFFAHSSAFANRGLNGKNCKAVVHIAMNYQPYEDEVVSSDFSNCPKTIVFDYGESNYNGSCVAVVGSLRAKIYYSFDILNLPSHDQAELSKRVSSSFFIGIPMNDKYSHDIKGSVLEVDQSVNQFRFPFWITPPRVNDNRLYFQFPFVVNMVDKGCLQK